MAPFSPSSGPSDQHAATSEPTILAIHVDDDKEVLEVTGSVLQKTDKDIQHQSFLANEEIPEEKLLADINAIIATTRAKVADLKVVLIIDQNLPLPHSVKGIIEALDLPTILYTGRNRDEQLEHPNIKASIQKPAKQGFLKVAVEAIAQGHSSAVAAPEAKPPALSETAHTDALERILALQRDIKTLANRLKNPDAKAYHSNEFAENPRTDDLTKKVNALFALFEGQDTLRTRHPSLDQIARSAHLVRNLLTILQICLENPEQGVIANTPNAALLDLILILLGADVPAATSWDEFFEPYKETSKKVETRIEGSKDLPQGLDLKSLHLILGNILTNANEPSLRIKTITIAVNQTPEVLRLTIADDSPQALPEGFFDEKAVRGRNGNGGPDMQKTAREKGWTLRKGTPEENCKFVLEIPLENGEVKNPLPSKNE